jgi:putative drug exporter of the RND superfamily
MVPTMSTSPVSKAGLAPGGPIASLSGPFAALGRFAVRRRWLVVAAWAVLLAIALPLAPRVVDELRAGGFILDDLESARAKTMLQEELGLPPSAVVVVLHSDTLVAGTQAFEAAAAEAVAGVADAPHVARVVPHSLATRQVSADGHTAYDVVLLTIAPDDSPAALPGIEAALQQPPELEVALAGGPAFYGDVQEVSESDLRRSELISLPLAAIALLFVFGSVVAAALPLAVGGTAVVVALAAVFLVASTTPMSIFVLNLATLLGLGLGVDYSLLLTSRFREELAARPPDDPDLVAKAVEATVATAGRAVFFSGLTVLLGLLGLVLFEFMILRSVGIAGAIVVFLAAASAVTLLPALLAIVGTRIDALAIRRTAPSDDPDGRWARLARSVMRRPIAVLVPTLALLLLLGWPFLHVRFNAPDSTILPASVPSRAAFDRLAATFGEGEFAPLTLAIQTNGPATSPENVAALYEYSRRLAADPRITRIEGLVDVDARLGLDQYQLLYADPNGPRDRFIATALEATTKDDLTAFTVYTPFGPNRAEGRELVTDLRHVSGPLAPPPGVSVLVGGGAADVTDVVDRVRADFPRTALFIVVSTYLVLFVLLRSAVLPLKALVMNTLSIVASFGALVWIFQDGNLSSVLGFQPLGFVETTQPVILFCVLFGLSMDYEVFLLSRMKEVWDQTGDNTEAVARGLERSGRIVTSAALIVVVVALSFAFADIVLIKALGIGMAIAVALDATVVRALLVPATMRLLGRWNWWMPGWAHRVPAVGTALLVLATPLLAGCTGPILAAPPAPHPTTPPAAVATPRPADPVPIILPRDDAPHDRLTEWWYYTGHLQA